MDSDKRWFMCYQIVCKCGFHTGYHELYSHTFNEYLRKIGAYEDFYDRYQDVHKEKYRCPLCGSQYDENFQTILAWNKPATDKQITYLLSIGVKNPENLLHESVNYILKNRERKAKV